MKARSRKVRPAERGSLWTLVATGQGLYYLITGIWPLVHMPSFLAVTGPKTDLWLVKTVGGLVGVLGASLLRSLGRGGPSRDLVEASVGSAAALTLVDVYFVRKRRISRVYLLDALAEALLIAGWAVAARQRS